MHNNIFKSTNTMKKLVQTQTEKMELIQSKRVMPVMKYVHTK